MLPTAACGLAIESALLSTRSIHVAFAEDRTCDAEFSSNRASVRGSCSRSPLADAALSIDAYSRAPRARADSPDSMTIAAPPPLEQNPVGLVNGGFDGP